MRFLTKPALVEAFRFCVDAAPVWFLESKFTTFSADECTIETLLGEMTAYRGDYIVRGTMGEIYPLNPEAFEKLHDGTDEETALVIGGWEP